MSLPASINYTSQYEAVLPTRIQWDVDDCYACSVLTAIELRGILTGQPVKQLSQLFLTWSEHSYGGTQPPYNPAAGGSSTFAATLAQLQGCCREFLWPISLIGANDYNQMRAAVNMTPNAACFLDAPNYKLVEWSGFPYSGDLATKVANMKSFLAAGYPISCTDTLAYSHEYCVVGYDTARGGVFCLDSHAWPQETFMPWERVSPNVVVKTVSFGIPKPVTITAAQIQSLQQLAAQFPLIVGSST